jgi:cell division protein FtsB
MGNQPMGKKAMSEYSLQAENDDLWATYDKMQAHIAKQKERLECHVRDEAALRAENERLKAKQVDLESDWYVMRKALETIAREECRPIDIPIIASAALTSEEEK